MREKRGGNKVGWRVTDLLCTTRVVRAPSVEEKDESNGGDECSETIKKTRKVKEEKRKEIGRHCRFVGERGAVRMGGTNCISQKRKKKKGDKIK